MKEPARLVKSSVCTSLLLLTTLVFAGCHTGKSRSHLAGSDLPVTSPDSVALPGATDAADAPHAPAVAESAKADLTAYHDPIAGVSFLYPTVWRPSAGQVLSSPDFAGVAGPPRITQQFLPEHTLYANTTLRAIAFSYTALKHGSAAACAAIPKKALAGADAARSVIYGGIPFTEAQNQGGAACTHVQAEVDTTYAGSRCFVFERDFVTGCPYTKSSTEPRPLTAQETVGLQQQLDGIMASVRIETR